MRQMHSLSILVPPAVKPGEYIRIEENGARAFREHAPMNEQNSVLLLVEHWQDNCFLILRKNDGLRTFITGDAEGQSVTRAMRTEIAREAGYIDISPEHILEERVHDKFYREEVCSNLFVHSTIVACKLKSGIRDEVPESERSLHVPEWVDANLVKPSLNMESHRYAWSLFLNHIGRA